MESGEILSEIYPFSVRFASIFLIVTDTYFNYARRLISPVKRVELLSQISVPPWFLLKFQPFFLQLFTQWVSSRDFAGIAPEFFERFRKKSSFGNLLRSSSQMFYWDSLDVFFRYFCRSSSRNFFSQIFLELFIVFHETSRGNFMLISRDNFQLFPLVFYRSPSKKFSKSLT